MSRKRSAHKHYQAHHKYTERLKQTIPRKKKGKALQNSLDQMMNHRIYFLILFIFICLSCLIARLYFLQVLEHENFITRSESNRIKLLPLAPSRGLIYDRNGVLLANGIVSNNLTITRQNIERPIDEIIDTIRETIYLSEQNITRFKRIFEKSPLQTPIIIKEQLSEEEMNALSVNLYKIIGTDISSQTTRVYPFKETAVHALGYVGRIDENDMKNIAENHKQDQYVNLTHMGKRGAEASFEEILRGKMGYEKVETDVSGRIVRKIDRTEPIPGQHVYLSIDIRLQEYAEKILGQYKGAIVAIDPKTGEILAFVSKPMFDPNLFVNGIESKTFQALNENPDFPFLNRVMRGNYPPGSTIKPQVGIAGLDLGTINRNSTVFCPGYFSVPGSSHRFRDWKKSGHGYVNLAKSIQSSCDVFFYDLAFNMGIEPMTDFLKKFSLGAPTGIDLTGESPGISPTPEFKKRRYKQTWYSGDTVTAGIGQSFWVTTPLQVAQATTIVSMKGQAFKPKMLHATRHPGQSTLNIKAPTPIQPILLNDPKNWDYIIASMVSVVHSPSGTARKLGVNIPYKIAGKTGTAQVKSIAPNSVYNASRLLKKHQDHAWFTAFAPAYDPKIAIAVIVENGGSGSGVAGPMAKSIINAWITDFKDMDEIIPLNDTSGE